MSSLFRYVDSVDALKDEYQSRLRRNKTYSMRAFARDIGASPSTLSEFFSAKHGISLKSAEKISQKIYLKAEEREYFLELCRLKNSQSEKGRESSLAKILQFKKNREARVALPEFNLIRDWFSLPLLEILKAKKDITVDKCAKLLGVFPGEMQKLCKSLVSLRLVSMEDGVISGTQKEVMVGDNIDSEDIKHFHKQILDKAEAALFHDPIDEREFSNNVFVIKKADLPEIKTELVKMRRDLQKKFESPNGGDEVYTLSLQFFSLLKDKNL